MSPYIGIGKPGVDQLDQILVVDRSVELVFAHGEGNDRHLPAELGQANVRSSNDVQRNGRRVRCRQRRFEKSVRSQHQLELPQIGVRHAVQIHPRERHRRVPLHVPRVVAAQNGRDVLLRHRSPAEQRVFSLPAGVILARPLRVVVDHARVVGNLIVRPVFGKPVGLADLREPAARGVLNRLQVGGAHGLGSRLQSFPGIHRLRGRGSGEQDEQSSENAESSRHTFSSLSQMQRKHQRIWFPFRHLEWGPLYTRGLQLGQRPVDKWIVPRPVETYDPRD